MTPRCPVCFLGQGLWTALHGHVGLGGPGIYSCPILKPHSTHVCSHICAYTPRGPARREGCSQVEAAPGSGGGPGRGCLETDLPTTEATEQGDKARTHGASRRSPNTHTAGEVPSLGKSLPLPCPASPAHRPAEVPVGAGTESLAGDFQAQRDHAGPRAASGA